ncbi:ankyrin repeat domain-containing protein [Pseudoroseomonas cervicalis]|uniref:ankyrin repeat domain-containing protein n=1 Tax=Teichococcus cervicalis TaxID=204525 RepID=UPI0035E87402
MRRLLKLAPLPLLSALLLGTALPAVAQGLRGPMVPEAQPQAPRRDPPALPGLAGRGRAPVIPAEPNQQSLGPNEALFDAINRGDMAAARDAMARGADLNARNVLGLTPIDSAVDQNRTDIAFFLLAARGTVVGGGDNLPPPPPADRAAPLPPRHATGLAAALGSSAAPALTRRRARSRPPRPARPGRSRHAAPGSRLPGLRRRRLSPPTAARQTGPERPALGRFRLRSRPRDSPAGQPRRAAPLFRRRRGPRAAERKHTWPCGAS